jgi:hypothetical protein
MTAWSFRNRRRPRPGLPIFLLALLASMTATAVPASAQDGRDGGDDDVATIDPAVDPLDWRSGPIVTQFGETCPGGIPAVTELIKSQVAYLGPANGNSPVPGEPWSVRVHFGVVGNPCPSGTAVVGTALRLPAGVSIALGRPDTQRCRYFSRSNATPEDVTSDPARCPTAQQLTDGWWLGQRAVPFGGQFQIDLTVISTRPLTGGSNDVISATVTPNVAVEPPTAAPTVSVPGGNLGSAQLSVPYKPTWYEIFWLFAHQNCGITGALCRKQ